MEGHTLRLAASFLRAAGWRKLIALLAITAVFTATFLGYAAATGTERNGLDWYLRTAFPDYELDLGEIPRALYDPANATSALANFTQQATHVSESLRSAPYVASAGPYFQLSYVSFTPLPSNGRAAGGLLFETAAMFQAQQSNYVDQILAGTSDLGPNGVLVPENVARADNLTVGETVPLYQNAFVTPPTCTANCTPVEAYANVTVQGIYAPKAGPQGYDTNVFPWAFSRFTTPVIMNLSQLASLPPTLVPQGSFPWFQFRYDVFVARDTVLDPFDDGGNAKRLGALRAQLSLVGQRYGLQLYSSLETAYDHFLQDRAYLDLAVLFGVAPVLLVAVVLGVLMESAEALARYRDLSIARSRGVGLRRLRRILWLEAFLEACLASALGLGAGILATLALVPDAAAALAAAFVIGSLVAFALSLGIALVMKTVTVRGLARQTIAEGLVRRVEPSGRGHAAGKVTSLAIGISVALFGVGWFSTLPLLDIVQAQAILFGTLRDWLLSLSLLALLFALCAYAPAATSRLASQSSRPDDATDAPALYRSALVRSKRSPDPAVVMVAALVLSAAVFGSGLVSLQQTSVTSAIYTETGSDILLRLPGNLFGGPVGESNPPLAAFLSVPGVANLTFASAFSSAGGIGVVLVNTTTYAWTVRTDMLSYGGTLQEALQGFSKPGAAVVNSAFVQATGLGAGSTFGNLTITGVVPAMPGLQPSSQTNPPTVYTDYRSYGVDPIQTDILWVLVRVAAGADPTAVTAQLASLDEYAIARDAPAEIGQIAASPLIGALSSLGTVGFGAFGFLLFVALGGYTVRARAELEADFARMRARGLRKGLVPRLLAVPMMVTVLVPIVWGVGLGELLLLVMGESASSVGGLYLAALLPSPLVVILIVAYVVLGLVLALALARGFERIRLGPRLRERMV